MEGIVETFLQKQQLPADEVPRAGLVLGGPVKAVKTELPSSNLTELWKITIYGGFSHEKW